MKQLTWIAAWDFVCWSTRFLSDVGDTKHERRKINNNYVHHLKSYITKWDFRQFPNFSAKFFQRLALQSWFTALEDTALDYLVINLERFSIESRKTKTKVITMSNQKEAKQEKLPKARENAGDQVVIGFSFASDWLGEWREFSEPITERNTEKFI